MSIFFSTFSTLSLSLSLTRSLTPSLTHRTFARSVALTKKKRVLFPACATAALPDVRVLAEALRHALNAACCRQRRVVREAEAHEGEDAHHIDFFCAFAFGEQGMMDDKPTHCNLAVNLALFG